MLILSRVCAEFHDRNGNLIHRVTPETRLTFQEAPEAIRQDPLFQLLVDDGSLEAAVTPVQKRKLEAEPLRGTDASGRRIRENDPKKEGEPGNTAAPVRKASAAAGQKPEKE